jgi:dTDP-4-amino-4,6-dideoxygalactose transaminase
MVKIRIPLASPAWEYEQLKAGIDAAVAKVLAEGRFILGPEVAEFEAKAAKYLGVKSSVGVSSGTDALLMALMALGVGPGDEVITTAFSFIATSSVIARLGARAVFLDIEEDGFNMDPALLDRAVTKKTRAIIVVHLFGQPADMDAILRIARQHKVAVIEDTAQAFGARYGMNRAGTMSDFGCFSFFPAKPLGCAGDAGLVVCTDARRDTLIRKIRVQGAAGKNVHPVLGGNFRIDTLQAAILKVKLEAIDGWIAERRRYAELYMQKLGGLSGRLSLPVEKEGTECVWAQFSVLAQDRDGLEKFLLERGIGCAVYYPMPLPLQESMKGTSGLAGSWPQTERVCREILSIPIHPSLTPDQVEEVAETIREFY